MNALIVDAIVLAAGSSSRLGRAKQLLPFAGTTLLGHAVDVARGAGVRRVVIVVGARAAEMRAEATRLGADYVENRDWQSGMGSSLRAGMLAIAPAADDEDNAADPDNKDKDGNENSDDDDDDDDEDADDDGPTQPGGAPDGVLVLLCDQPRIDVADVVRIVARWHAQPDAVVACEYDGTLGAPALFPRSAFARLRALDGATGAKAVILGQRDHLERIDCPAASVDIDTEADWTRLHFTPPPRH